MTATLPSLPDVDVACRKLELGLQGSELHGGLAGWLAGGGANTPDWLGKVMADDGLPAPEADSVLDALRTATVGQYDDADFGFELLLPAADVPLDLRSEALFAWCRGFVGAFGLAAGNAPPLSEDSNEALADLVRLAGASPDQGGDDEDEDALAEIEEFVRVAAMLLHGDCVLGRRHRSRLN